MKRILAILLTAALLLAAIPAFAKEYKDKDVVKQAQQALNDAGYDCGTPDGVAGKKTKNAIKSYQADHDLEETGVVDDELLASLGLAEAEEAANSTGEASESVSDEADEVTLPSYLVRAFGGVPENVSELSDRYDLSYLSYMLENWDLNSVVEELRDGGEAQLELPGFGTTEYAYISCRSTEGNYAMVELKAKGSKGSITLTQSGGDPIPEAYDYASLSVTNSKDVNVLLEQGDGWSEVVQWDASVYGRRDSGDSYSYKMAQFIDANLDDLPEHYTQLSLLRDLTNGYLVDIMDRYLTEDDTYDDAHWYARYDADGTRLWRLIPEGSSLTVAWDAAGRQVAEAMSAEAEAAQQEAAASDNDIDLDNMTPQQILSIPDYFVGNWYSRFSADFQSRLSDPDDSESMTAFHRLYLPSVTYGDYEGELQSWIYDAYAIEICIDAIYGEDGYQPPNEITMYFWIAKEGRITFVDTLGLRTFLSLANTVYGGTDEDINELIDLLDEDLDDDGYLVLDDLVDEDRLFETDTYYIVCGSWEDGGKAFFIVRPNRETSFTELQGDDAPEIPDDVIEATGGLPENVSELIERYDADDLEEIYALWNPEEMLAEIVSEGSYTVPGGAFGEVEYAELYYEDINGEGESIELEVSTSGNQVQLTTKEGLPDVNYLGYYGVSVSCDDEDNDCGYFISAYTSPEDGWDSYEVEKNLSYYDLGSYDYVDVDVAFSGDDEYSCLIRINSGLTTSQWQTDYDADGNRGEIYYLEYQ